MENTEPEKTVSANFQVLPLAKDQSGQIRDFPLRGGLDP